MPPVGSKKRSTGSVVAGSEKLIESSIHDLDDLRIEAKNSKRRLCTSKGKQKSLSGRKRHSYADSRLAFSVCQHGNPRWLLNRLAGDRRAYSRFQPHLLSAIACPPIRRYPKGFLSDYRHVECRLSYPT